MSKQEVKLILDETKGNRRLIVRKKDGTEYNVTIFSGGGYYDVIWLRTDAEIAEGNKQREANEKQRLEDMQKRVHQKKVNGLARLIMFMQRRKREEAPHAEK